MNTDIIVDLGFTIASAITAGYFVFLTLKFILSGLILSIQEMQTIICRLNSRVTTLTEDTRILDIEVSNILGIKPQDDRRR